MEARQLKVFLAVVEHGGVTKAAEALYVSQPAVSQTLRAFEAQLGVALFHRTTRGLDLTAEGAALVEPARRLVGDLADADEAVRAVVQLRTGRLDIVADAAHTLDPLTRIAGRLHERHPGIVINVRVPDDGPDLVDSVRRGVCELGIVGLPVAAAHLRVEPIGSRELLLFEPPGEDRGRAVALAELTEPLLLPPQGLPDRAAIEEAFAVVGARPAVAVECGNVEAMANMVLAGAGSTFFPRSMASSWRRLGGRVCATVPAVVRETALLSRPGSLSPAARAFVAAATE
ncbi:LysR family transcriptional regulator [Amycolatopsis sp. NPDC004368]